MKHSLIQAAFVLLTLGSFAVLFAEIRNAVRCTTWLPARKSRFNALFLAGLMGWTLFVSIWSISGKMSNFLVFPMNMMPVLAVPLIAILLFTFSKAGKEILLHVPEENIIRLQAFRFFVELMRAVGLDV